MTPRFEVGASMSTIIFDPGQILMTPGAIEALKRAKQLPSEFVLRHICLDKGDLCDSDHRENISAMKCGLRVIGHFTTAAGDGLWLISEWVDVKAGGNPKKRELTTIFLPEEY
jgi:hypothetical protein